MDERKKYNHPWDDSVYGTGRTEPPKSHGGTVALLLAKSEVYDEVEAKLTCQGVFTLAKPTSALLLNQEQWNISGVSDDSTYGFHHSRYFSQL